MTIQEKLAKAETIIKELKVLRGMQREYFKTRDTQLLNKCKIQEKKIDEMLTDYTKQPELFP